MPASFEETAAYFCAGLEQMDAIGSGDYQFTNELLLFAAELRAMSLRKAISTRFPIFVNLICPLRKKISLGSVCKRIGQDFRMQNTRKTRAMGRPRQDIAGLHVAALPHGAH